MAKKYSTAEAAAINSKFGEDTKYKVQNGVLKIKQAMTAREKAEQPTNKKGYVWGTSIGKEPSGVTSALMSKQRTVKTRSGDSAVTAGKLASAVKRSSGVVKTKKGDGTLASVVKRPPMSKRGDGKLASAVKRSSGVVKKKRKIPEGRSINMKVPKSVSKMSLAEKKVYFNVVNKERPSVKREIKKSSVGTFVTYPQFTLAEYLKLSKHDRYLMGLPETDERLSRNSRNILTFTQIKN